MHKYPGKFISFEGGEGAGKSTQIRLLKIALEQEGKTVIQTREPGGSDGAEMIRDLLVHGSTDRWDAKTEALLMYASRRDHLVKTVLPALEAGTWVLCDRFNDSSFVYQGFSKGISPEDMKSIDSFVCEGIKPNLTFICDIPPEVGLKRAGDRDQSQGNRFENMDFTFHKKIREGFLDIAKNDPDRCVVLDAAQNKDAIHAAIMMHVKDRFCHD